MKRTKIICTLGPSANDEETIEKLILSGMDVARFNFSHADHEEHMGRLKIIKKLRKKLNKPIATLLDTKGPEIRIGDFKDKVVDLKEGQLFTLTNRDIQGDETIVSITYKDLPQDVKVDTTILIDDGLVEMIVEEVTETDIICKVLNDGRISDKKGVNVPNVFLSMPYLSQKDRDDILFAIESGYDFIAASFVRTADDVLQIRQILEENNASHINIVSKIENNQGVENIDEIIEVSDCIMIARGDMGVEMPYEDLPSIQKMIIKKVSNSGKVVITATQMLESMIKHPRPTRAEATDVANAIYDGTSAIMLSGETANGAYPVEAVQTMARIARRTEQDVDYLKRFNNRQHNTLADTTTAISRGTCDTAHTLNARAIVTVTKSGETAKMVSRFRPAVPIVACTSEENTYRQLNLTWGVTPLMIEEKNDTFKLFDLALDTAEKANCIEKGELAVLTAGVPLRVSGTTNLIKVQIAGE